MKRLGILHYTTPPVVGGVEAVIAAHARVLLKAGYPLRLLAGRGEVEALPDGAELELIPELDSQNEEILTVGEALEGGNVPDNFESLVLRIANKLRPALEKLDVLFAHNVLTKHFNIPLTAALHRLADESDRIRWVAWCHDFSWTSPRSRKSLHPGYPWDLLRTPHARYRYATISAARRTELADLLGLPEAQIEVIYNGVDAAELLAIDPEAQHLAVQLGLDDSELFLIMPVRVTRAKNIEYALKVAAGIRDRGIDVRVVLTGPPDPHDPDSLAYFEQLITLRRSLDLERQFRFIFELGLPGPGKLADFSLVAQLYRLSDAVLMPSLREGFGMPVVEGGLLGIPVFCSPFPAAVEIGGPDVTLIDLDDPDGAAEKIAFWFRSSPEPRLRLKARRLTWEGIFRYQMLPLIEGDR